jgi:hypothetical protein
MIKKAVCPRCHHEIHRLTCERANLAIATSMTIKHDYYGCDSGCCGHKLILYDAQDHKVAEDFEFVHAGDDDPLTWARSWAEHAFPMLTFREDLMNVLSGEQC